jgi:uncharacterized protein YifE (UPF0438 family)
MKRVASPNGLDLHRKFSRKRGYLHEKSVVGLSDGDRAILDRHGFWLEALSQGRIPPLTQEQKRFCQVSAGKMKAETPYEHAWSKYKKLALARRMKEKKARANAFRKERFEKERARSTRIVRDSILMGEAAFQSAKKTELQKGFLSEREISEIFEANKQKMPNEDLRKKVITNLPGSVCTTAGHDPYR